MGGSSGGGGSSSGKVDYPQYIKDVHNDWLDNTGSDSMTSSVVDLMNAAIGSSPFAGAIAYDPASDLADAWAAVCAFNTVVDAMDHEGDWLSAMSAATTEFENNLIDPSFIEDEVKSFAQIQDNNINYQALPQFRAGYRDVNAVMSSAFAIGEAIIWGMNSRDIAKYHTELSLRLNMAKAELVTKSAEVILNSQIARVDFEKAVAHISVEAKRIDIVASKEELDQQISWDESDGLWDLKTYHYGVEVMAGISGAISSSTSDQPSTGQSALGGALSGAASGAMVGGVPGAIVGGLLGLGASLL